MFLIFKTRALQLTSIYEWHDPRIHKKSVKTKNVCHISKGFNRLDAEKRFILRKYCVEFTSVAVALNYDND